MNKGRHFFLFAFSLGLATLLALPAGMKDYSDAVAMLDLVKQKAPTETERQYIGYGFNVTSDKAICDIDALMLNNPILDVDDPELLNLLKSFDASQTTYLSNSSSSVSSISESYGLAMSGGVRGSVTAIKLNVESSFNTNIGWSSSSTKREEYSYHTIVAKNKTVVLQANTKQLREHLDSRFLESAKAIKNQDDAKQLIKTYGSHLLTGYTLGGLFELTNYFATDSSSYVRELGVSFDTQVSTAINYAGAEIGTVGTDFSFGMNYSSKDNNSHAVNSYKCTTFGGVTFPGLTIEQAFQYYETAFGAGYIYQIWTDSINQGKNLVICDIPQSSKMIPIWEILPLGGDYDRAKVELADAYLSLAADGVAKHNSKYPDVVSSIQLPEPEVPSFKLNGYTCFSGNSGDVVTQYFPVSDSKVPEVSTGQIIALDFNEGPYNGVNLEWIVEGGDERAEILDKRSGIFRVGQPSQEDPELNKFRVSAYVGLKKVFGKTFEINQNEYALGNGTEKDPYIISSPAQLVALSNKPEDWDKYFELGADLDMAQVGSEFQYIGNQNIPFSGHFDGAYHVIKNITFDFSFLNTRTISDIYLGLFGYVSGTISRLNIEKMKVLFNAPVDTNNYTTDLDTPATAIRYASFLAGRLTSTGILEECVVKNSTLSLNSGSLNVIKDYLYAGGLVGYDNDGYISDCHVVSSSVAIKNELQALRLYAGGLIGYASNPETASNSAIIRCSNVKTSVSAYRANNVSGKADVRAGGLIAYATSINLEDVLVNEPSTISATSDSTHTASESYAGGLIGELTGGEGKNSSIVRAVTTKTASKLIAKTGSGNIVCGSLIGKLQSQALSQIGAVDAAVDDVSGLYIVANTLSTAVDGVTAITNLSWSSSGLSSNIKDSDVWRNKSGYPSIYYRIIDKDLFEFDFSNVKTEFILGEEFKTGEISISGYDSDGNDFAVTAYSVNSNAFHSDEVGVYPIIVSCYGASESYDVTVNESVLSSLKVEVTPRMRYEGEAITKQDFKVYPIDELGQRGDAYSDNEFTLSSSEVLVKGDNLCSVSTLDGKISTEFVLTAKQRFMTGLDWTEEAPEIKAVYGTREVDLKGSSFTVTYNEGPDMVMDFTNDSLLKVSYNEGESKGSYDLDANCVDIIIPQIKYGKGNIGKISYGDYTFTLDFDIEGLGAPEETEITRFVTLVESIEQSETLFEKHEAIRMAYKLLESFGDYRDDAINEASKTLDEQAQAYDLEVNAINAEIEQGIVIFSSFNYEILSRAGVISYTLIIALILALL